MKRKMGIKQFVLFDRLKDRQFWAFLLLLYYPFNNSIASELILGSYSQYIFFFLGAALLIPDFNKKITKNNIKICLVAISAFLFSLVGNKLFGTNLNNISAYVIWLLYILLVPYMSCIKIKKESFFRALGIYAIEHIIGTAIPIIVPGFYKETVLEFICKNKTYCFARTGFRSGLNAGLTSHYSTNGCYLSVSAIMSGAQYFAKKRKKTFIFMLLSIIALLVIGKRAHLVFVSIVLLIGYLKNKVAGKASGILSRIGKGLIVMPFVCVGAVAIINCVPQASTTINRIISSSNDDISNGRTPLYELAIEEWQKSPIYGKGWGNFVVSSHNKFGKTSYHLDYIHAHNDYLELLCDRGLIGLMVYLGIIISIVFKMNKKEMTESSLFLYMFGLFYLLYGVTGTPLYIPSMYATLLIAFSMNKKEKLE